MRKSKTHPLHVQAGKKRNNASSLHKSRFGNKFYSPEESESDEPFEISASTLHMLDLTMMGFLAGHVSEPIDISSL